MEGYDRSLDAGLPEQYSPNQIRPRVYRVVEPVNFQCLCSSPFQWTGERHCRS
jgi:hypothetical protein